MSVDPIWQDYSQWKFGRPFVSTDPYDEPEWQAFQTGWQQRDLAVLQLADVGRRVLYGLSIADVRPTWFQDRAKLGTLVTQGLDSNMPAPPDGYTDAQALAFNAGWTTRQVQVAPIYTVGTDVLEGLTDGRALAADLSWMAERDQLKEMLGV